ncbi:MAG: hypothetical protein JWN67_639 [Actinomycetia bacterium]|nr:hypothetical protein [Actinomycetes bacterium]
MRSLAGPLALLLVALAPVAALGAVSSAGQWGRWLVRAGGVVGILGLVLTAAATVNLLVPRTCATAPVKTMNRPVLSIAVDEGDCFRSALGQVGLAGLVGVTASAAVAAMTGARRWSRGDGAGAAPAVPSR